jgi:hypothetical protein
MSLNTFFQGFAIGMGVTLGLINLLLLYIRKPVKKDASGTPELLNEAGKSK